MLRTYCVGISSANSRGYILHHSIATRDRHLKLRSFVHHYSCLVGLFPRMDAKRVLLKNKVIKLNEVKKFANFLITLLTCYF